MSDIPLSYWYGLAVGAIVIALLVIYIAINWREK